MAAKWLKATLFGRQLSHGSDKESPETFEDALQSPFNFEPQQQQQQQMPMEQSQGFEYGEPTLTPYSNISGASNFSASSGASPGASEMKAAYDVLILIALLCDYMIL